MKFNNEEVRRQDRLLDEKRAFEILQSGEYGVLSMQDENGTGAYGVPVNYVWDRGNSIYIHCAPAGRKLACIDACNQVSFLRCRAYPRSSRQVYYRIRKRDFTLYCSPGGCTKPNAWSPSHGC